MVDSEATLKRQVILRIGEALSDREVRGDHDPRRSDHCLRALGFRLKRIVVRPDFQMMGSDLFGTHLLDDDDVFALVSVPPEVVALDEGFGEGSSDVIGLTCSGYTVVPLVLQQNDRSNVFFHNVKEVKRLLKLSKLLNRDEAVLYGPQRAVLENQGITRLRVALDSARSRRKSVVERALDPSVVLSTVVPSSKGIPRDLNMRSRETFDHRRQTALSLVTYTRLEVKRATLTAFELSPGVNAILLQKQEEIVQLRAGIVRR